MDEHQGWIKCRLLHGQGSSLIIPDQLYLEHSGLWWIQPLAFSPNPLAKLSEDDIRCTLGIDISCGQRVVAQFTSADRVATLEDGAELFRCRIQGPRGLHRYATGEAEWQAEGLPYLRLYHHSTKELNKSSLTSRSSAPPSDGGAVPAKDPGLLEQMANH